MLSIMSNVKSKITGFDGIASNTETVVDSKGRLNNTLPVAVNTSISPLDKPKRSGNKIIKLLPNSSTVAVKSVPLTAMLAVGVDNFMFCLSILLKLPVINLAVPKVNFNAIFDLLGSGSKMYSFIMSSEYSVSFTCVSSKNLIASLPFLVTASSFCWIANFNLAS